MDAYIIDVLCFCWAFQVKHFLCDYIFQGKYMLGKFKPYPEYILPLVAHSAVQAGGTFLLALLFHLMFHLTLTKVVFLVTATDFVTHFIIDRIKASPKLLGRFKPDQPYFWWALGWDQMCHHLVNIILVGFLFFWR